MKTETKEKRYYDSLVSKGLQRRGVLVHPDDWPKVLKYARELRNARTK